MGDPGVPGEKVCKNVCSYLHVSVYIYPCVNVYCLPLCVCVCVCVCVCADIC